MWAFQKRHRLIRSGMYDIDGFIRQLLASDKFDELAEKLAEKAANKIKHIEVDHPLGEKASRVNKVLNYTESMPPNIRAHSDEKHEKDYGKNSMEIVKVFAQNTRAQSDEKRERSSTEIIKSFIGKIDPKAVMNESIALSENLKLKYKYLKKNLKNHRDPIHKNVTIENRSNQNKTNGPPDDKLIQTTEYLSPNQNGTQINKNGVKMESDDKQQEVTTIVPINSSAEDVHDNESSQKQNNIPKETKLRADPNSGPDVKEQEANNSGKAKIEDHPSSLEEEKKAEEVTQKIDTKESNELLKALGYEKGHTDSVEENKVPSGSDNPYLRGGGGAVFRTEDSNDSGGLMSIEKPAEDMRWTEKGNEHPAKTSHKPEDPAKPVLRKEGDKTYTFVQNSDYQEYHEEMAKWRKEHPKNSADFM